MVYMMRAICLSGLESSSNFRRGRPLGPGLWAPAIGARVVGVGHVAGVAVDAQRAGPFFHGLVYLAACGGFGKDFQVGRRGIVAHLAAAPRRHALLWRACSGGW